MTPGLILVTTNYPYTHTGGEVMFVGPEIPCLVEAFGTLRVVPLHARGERLEIPAGVEVDTTLSAALAARRWRDYLLAPAWPGFGAELARALQQGGWVGCARVWRWAAAAQATYRWARAGSAEPGPRLYYTYWRSGSTLALARLAGERPRTAAVTRVHGHDLYAERYAPPFQPWHPALYQELASTVTISQHGHDYLRNAGVPAARLRLSRLGIGAADAATHAPDASAVRIVSCSSVDANKRVTWIAEALIGLARRHPAQAIRWIHFGAGPELARVRKVLQQAPANLQPQLPGRVPHAVVVDHYAAEPVDAFVLLSASEGLPMSLQEAARAGLPIVATDVGGVAELVGDDNGALVPAGASTGDVVAALERVLWPADPADREGRRAASRRRWADDFDARRNHRRLATHLRSLLDAL